MVLDEGEECDDGNLKSGDGCDRRCKKERGFHCPILEGDTHTTCSNCGNGIIEGTE